MNDATVNPATDKKVTSDREDGQETVGSETFAAHAVRVVAEQGAAVGQAAGSIVGNAADAARQAQDRVSAVSSAVGERLSDAAAHVPSSEDVAEGARGVRSAVLQNPFALALGAVAAGALVGLILPITDVERDQVGPLGQKFTDAAAATGGELVEKGKAAAAGAVASILGSGPSDEAT